MPDTAPARTLLNAVRRRLFWDRTLRRTVWVMLSLGAVYAVALLVSRFTAYVPNWFAPWTLAIPPGLAVLGALLFPVRVSLQDAARTVDAAGRSRDLFLTYSLLGSAVGEFGPLVDRDADAAAARVAPQSAVPFEWVRPLRSAAACLALLLCGVLFLPQFDPFGKQAEADEVQKVVRKLEQDRKSNEIRKAQLKERDSNADVSEDVEESIKGLQNQLKTMKRGELKPNFEKLVISQKQLGDKFRTLNSALKELMQSGKLNQTFGGQHASELKKWQQDLQQGGGGSLSKELEEMKRDLEQLLIEDDPVKKTELRRQIEKKLGAIEDFARERSGSKSLSAAIERARDQLNASKDNSQLAHQALEGMRESLDLAQMEVESLAQAARDLKALEEALETLAMAKQLNQDGELDGELVDALTALEEYKELYEQLLAEMNEGEGEGENGDGEGDGDGDGLGGEGMGRGDKAPEDDSVETGFTPEQSKSPVTQGKILLSLKTKGLGERGDMEVDVRQALEDVKQAYAEAIDAEEIPPGYHEGIKSYFNALDEPDLTGPAAAEAPSADEPAPSAEGPAASAASPSP